ncbi:MAG TPA: hypothetical protein VGZ27_14935, partial [Vicinamibacterales bacterium]|nr:hypothetical protein [Vicinamibacterales bacterium]
SWRAALPGLRQVGGKLAIVTAELGGRSQALGDIAGPGSVTLCDVDYGVTLAWRSTSGRRWLRPIANSGSI